MKFPLIYGTTLLLLLVIRLPSANAQLLDPSFTPPTSLYAPGTIYALGPLQADGKRLMSGTFSRINGSNVSRLVRIDANGTLDQAFSQRVGYVVQSIMRIRALTGGQQLIYAPNGSLSAGGISRTQLVRLNADGSGDASFNAGTGANSTVNLDFAAQPDGKIVAVGGFSSFNSTPAASVVRLNANGGIDGSFNAGSGVSPASGEAVQAVLVLPTGKIMVGGRFAVFNGQPANGLARLNADGTVDASFTSPFNQAITRVEGLLLQPDGNLLVSGLLSVNSTTRPSPGLVRLLPSGAPDPTFSSPNFLDGRVTASGYGPAVLLQPDGHIVVSGSFAVAGAQQLVRLSPTGAVDPTFQVNTASDSFPRTIGLQANGSILVGGVFNTFNGVRAPLVQLLGSSGAPDPAFSCLSQSPGSIVAMVRQPDGKFLIGGLFSEINGQAVSYLARLTDTGTLDAAFSAAAGPLPTTVGSLALQPDGKVLAGTVRGTFRFGTTGSPDPSFSAPYTTMVLALQADGKVLLGGQFGAVANGVLYNRLVRLTDTGAIDPSFYPQNSGATANTTDAILVQPDGRIVVAGTWTSPGQSTVSQVMRYETSGSLDPTYSTAQFTAGTAGAAPRLAALARQADGKVVALGSFAAVNGTARSGVARLTTTGALDPTFTPSIGLGIGLSTVVVQPNSRLLIGGAFFASNNAYGLLRLLNNGSFDASFGSSTSPNDGVAAITIQPDGAIVVAGRFTTLGGQPAVGIARIVASDVLAVAAPAAVGARTSAWPVPAHGQLHVAPDASARLQSLELLDALGRPQRRQAATAAAEQTLDLAGLPAGCYLLRLHYASGTVTQRIAVQ